jgi:GT2 family glycosyltransferase
MSDTPAISVVIPTINRPQAIVDLVHDLQKQNCQNFEIIVVDQSESRNETLDQLATDDRRLTVIRSAIIGTCHARNIGVAAARGEIVVFTDDDVRIADPKFLAAHHAPYRDQTIGGVGGRVVDVNLTLNREQTGPVCFVSRTGRIYPNATSQVRQDINAPRGGNMSFRRSIISDVGGFDEHFRGNAMREETDFSLRVVKAGWRIGYEPGADLVHLALPGGTRSVDRITWYRDFFFNESYFFLKHFPRSYLPVLLWRKLRPIIACATWYGRLKPAAIAAPWQAFGEAWALTHKKTAA